MAREYQKTNWQNTPSTATPLSADNLNHIEDGIYNLETKVENNASAVSDLQSGKVDKVTGKGLSTNDFTDTYKSQIETNQANVLTIFDRLETKVDKVTGKGLSTNDFTNNDVDKLRNDTYTKSETRGLVSKAYHPAGSINVEDLTASILISANLNYVYNLNGDGTTSNLFIEGAGHPLEDGTNIGVFNFGTDESPNILFDDLGGFVDLSGYATTSAMNTALADKVDKVSGKGLSTNDFTDSYKSQIETNQGNILTLFDDKVDKVTGKGLSTNDFTDEYINAINDNTDNISDNTIAIQDNADNITALQNNKVDKVVGKGLSTNDFTNNFKKGIAISQELAYDRATIPQPNLDADFHTVNGERTVIYQGNTYSFDTMTYNPISKKYVYGIRCTPVYQGGLFFCEVDNPASDRHNWLDQTTFPTDILINGDIYTAVMPTGEAYYVSYSYNNNDEKELVYSDALDSSRLDYWVKTEIIIDSIFNIGNYVFYVADNKVYKYEFTHGSVELDFTTVPFAYTYGGGRYIALTKNQYNVISAFMSYDGIEWTKVNFPSINKTNEPSGLIYDHGIFLFYQKEDEYVITSKDGFSWEKHKLSINVTEYRENYMIFDEIGWGGGIFYACGDSVDEGHYDDYTIWTSQDGYTWEQTVKYLEDEINGKTDYYNGTYLISVAQNLYYPTYRLDGVYGKGDVYTKAESNSLVVANPTDEAEGTLNKLTVNGTTYNLPQGGETNVQADWTETDPTSGAYIQHKPTLGTASTKDVASSGNASSSQVVMGNDTRLTDARPAADVSSWAKQATKPTYTANEVGAYTKTESDNKYVAKETGKGLSTNDYTTADKNKLAGIEAEANKTVVDSEMNDSSTNPLQNKVITKELEGAKTTTGNPLTIEDAAPVNAVNLSMDLEPIQDLHGYDHPWVGGARKNKLPMTVDGIKAQNGSASWSGNICTLDGVSFEIITDNDENVIGIKANRVAASSSPAIFNLGAYTASTGDILNGCPNGGGNSTYKIYARGGSTGDTGTGATIASGDVGVSRIYAIAVFSDASPSNMIFYPMIRLSTETDSSFAPYTNKASISGRSEVAIQRVGKNLFGGLDFANKLYDVSNVKNINTTDKTIQFNRCDSIDNNKLFNKFKPNTDYTLIITGKINTSGQKNTSLRFGENGITFDSTTKSTQRIYISADNPNKEILLYWYDAGNATLYYDECGLFEGNVSIEEFEEYLGKTYTIQIGQTVYGGQLDVTNGKMVVDKGYVDLGDLSYTYESSNIRFYTYISEIISKGVRNTLLECSCYQGIDDGRPFADVPDGAIYTSGPGATTVYIHDSRYTDGTQLKTALSGQQLVYPIEPFTIDLTPQQIKLLENTNTISSDGSMTLEYQPNNAIGEAVRAVEESYDPEFAVRPPLKKIAFSGTTDTDGSVTLINASDIPNGHKIIPLHITDMTIDGSAGTYFVEYKPYNSGDSVKAYCYFFFDGSRMVPVNHEVTGNFYYYELEG